MRITLSYFILLFCTIQLLTASSGNSQELHQMTVTLSAEKETLKTVLKRIEQKTGLSFVMPMNEVETYTDVSLPRMRRDIKTTLDLIFANTHLGYRQINARSILIYVKNREQSRMAPSVILPDAPTAEIMVPSIRGKVSDEKGETLPGVNILVKGTQQGTITDENGNFQLEVSEGAILVLSFVGYETMEIKVGTETFLDLSLKVDQKSLEEVVVVGYGTQRKSDITGSVASVPQERLEMVPNLNIAQAIQGAVSGVMIQQAQGGAASNEVMMIRGRNSILASNDPLIIVDGIPYSGQIRDINVNDVKSIEVLKDASAAAIYGSRGANGVILITTKMGGSGKPVIAYDGRYSVQNFTRIPRYLNGEEFYNFKQTRWPGAITASEQAVYESGQWTNWLDLALRQGASNQHNLSVSGGFKGTQYYIGGSYLDVKGLAITDNYKRITTRINVDTKIASWLTIGTRTQLSYDDRSGAPLNWTVVFRKNPLIRPYDENGNLKLYPWPEYNDIANPLEPVNYDNTNESYQAITNNYAVIDFPFLKGLSYRINTGFRKRFSDVSTYMGRNTKTGLEARGYAETNRGNSSNSVVENVLSYQREINKHTLFITGLYSYERNINSDASLIARGFPHDFLTTYAAAQAEYSLPEFSYNKTVLISQMLRVNYSYNSRYLLTLTGRRDGFSGFGAGSKWGMFPSVALGWNLSQEAFFPFRDTFDDLKLRASLGKNGNQGVSAYESISRLSELNMSSQGASLPGYIPSKLGQDNLGWETTKTLNIGIDYSILRNRIQGDINWYKTNTFDLLLNRSISSVHGINTITQNIGKTENKGIEVSLHTKNIASGDFRWNSNGNFSFVRNKIISLYGELDENGKEIDDVANAWFIGKPILVYYNYVWDGVWQQHEADEAAKWGTGVTQSRPGFLKLKDVNGDGKMTADEDRQIIGQKDPKFLWGMSHNFSYRNFNLDIFIHGVHGVTKDNELMKDHPSGSEVRRSVILKNWWTPENPTNEWIMNDQQANQMGGASTNYYQNASFVRVKDIALSYDFPKSLIRKTGMDKLRVYVSGRNLATFTKWGGMDPELDYGNGGIPLQKEFVFGLNLGF